MQHIAPHSRVIQLDDFSSDVILGDLGPQNGLCARAIYVKESGSGTLSVRYRDGTEAQLTVANGDELLAFVAVILDDTTVDLLWVGY